MFEASHRSRGFMAIAGAAALLAFCTARGGDASPRIFDPATSTELDVSPVTTKEPTAQAAPPQLACRQPDCLVVWTDERGLRGARIDAQSALLDAVGFPIPNATEAFGADSAAVTFDGTDYVVAWTSTLAGASGVYVTRVAPSGAVSEPATLVEHATVAQDVAISADPQGVLVAWVEYSIQVRAAHVSSAGAVSDTIYMPARTAPYATVGPPYTITSLGPPAIAWNGTEHLVGWLEDGWGSMGGFGGGIVTAGGVNAARVGPTGALIDTVAIPVSGYPAETLLPAGQLEAGTRAFGIASSGSDFFVAWVFAGMRGVRVNAAGVVLDSAPITIGSLGSSNGAAAVGFDGAHYVVASTRVIGQSTSIIAARVAIDGTVLDGAPVRIDDNGFASAYQMNPAVAFNGTTSSIVWAQTDTSVVAGTPPIAIHAARFAPDGTTPDRAGALRVSQTAITEEGPAIAFDGTNYLVAWRSFHDHETYGSYAYDVVAARVTPSGALLDPAGIVLETHVPQTPSSGNPTVAFDGANYLVHWGGAAKRVHTDGSLLGGNAIALPDVAPAALVFGGGTTMAIGIQAGRVVVYRVRPDGTAPDGNGIIVTSTTAASAPVLAFDGASFVAIWNDARSGTTDVYSARISPAGAVLDPGGKRLVPAATQAAFACRPAECLLLWRAGALDVRGSRVVDGALLDATGFAVPTSDANAPGGAMAWDGVAFVRVSPTSRTLANQYALVTGTRFPADGGAPVSFPIDTGALHSPFAAIGTDGNGGALAAYETFDPAPPYGTFRARMRWLGRAPAYDGGVPDDGGSDAGATTDASASTDAGTSSDASASSDGGVIADGGSDGDAPRDDAATDGGEGSSPGAADGGCAVARSRSTSSAPLFVTLAIAAAACARRRRRGTARAPVDA